MKKNIFLFVVMYLFIAGRCEFEISGGKTYDRVFNACNAFIYMRNVSLFSEIAKVIAVLYNKNKNNFYRSYNSHYCLLFNVFF